MISVVRGKGAGGLLTLEVHSPKNLYELSCVKMFVHGEHNPLLPFTGVT